MNFQARWHYELARLFLFFKMEERAVTQLEAALRNDSEYVVAHESLAFLHASAGRGAAAVASFRRALDIAPDHASTWLTWVSSTTDEASTRRPVHAFARAVELSPSLDRAWYGMGLAQRSLGRLPEAAVSLNDRASSSR